MKSGVSNSVVFMLIIIVEEGQVIWYGDVLDMMILKIGIGVMWLIFIGTANHLIGHIIQEHFITSLLGSLALVNIHFLLSKLAWQVFWTKINFIQMKLPNFVNSLPDS